MKHLLTIIFLLPLFAMAQTFPGKLITADKDTILFDGKVNYTLRDRYIGYATLNFTGITYTNIRVLK